jgi:hypothetical protein
MAVHYRPLHFHVSQLQPDPVSLTPFPMKTAIEHFKERMNVSRTLCGSDFKIDFIRYLPDELGKSIAADAPKVVYEEGRKIWVSTKSAYAIQPGNDLAGVRAFLENELPGDFLEFYREIRGGAFDYVEPSDSFLV